MAGIGGSFAANKVLGTTEALLHNSDVATLSSGNIAVTADDLSVISLASEAGVATESDNLIIGGSATAITKVDGV